jgi:hypothetical protein
MSGAHGMRAFAVAVLAVLGTVLLSLSMTVTTTVQLLATYALKGTQIVALNINSNQEFQREAILYGVGTPGSPPMVVQYPASGRPFSPGFLAAPTIDQSVRAGIIDLQNDIGGDPTPVIFGFSQGAIVATEYKKALNANPANTTVPTFVLTGNPNRPNGGLLERFAGLYIPILDLTANGATPTHTVGANPGENTTTDIAGEYDPVGDFPTNPLNPVSLANAAVGLFVVHLSAYQSADPSTKILQDRYGDTSYYLLRHIPCRFLFRCSRSRPSGLSRPTCSIPSFVYLSSLGMTARSVRVSPRRRISSTSPTLRASVRASRQRYSRDWSLVSRTSQVHGNPVLRRRI